jgi:hypothetical protein
MQTRVLAVAVILIFIGLRRRLHHLAPQPIGRPWRVTPRALSPGEFW